MITISTFCFGQRVTDNNTRIGYTELRANGIFHLPEDTILSPSVNANICQQLAKKNGIVYQYSCSYNKWIKLLDGAFIALDSARRSNDTLYFRKTGGGELAVKMDYYTTTQVNALLAGKVNVSDTAGMLSPYLRKRDTVTLSNRINAKLNIADTTIMLSPYLRKTDTTNMLSPYLRKRDTITLSNRINLKENLIAAGTTAQYRRGDKTWQMLNVAAIGGLQDSLNVGDLQRTTERGNVTDNTVVLSGMNKLTGAPGTSSLLHSTIDHSFNMFNTSGDGTVNSTIQLGDGKMDFTSNPDNYIRSNAGEFGIRAVTPDGNATLELSSSAVGGSQFDLWKVDPTYQYGIFSDMVDRKVGFAVEVAGHALPGFPHQSVNLIAEKDSTAVRFISGTAGNSSLIKTNNSFRFNYDNSSNPIGLQMATVLNEVKNNFFKDGRVSGADAVNNNEYTTLGQNNVKYIQSQFLTAQASANFYISGSGQTSNNFVVRKDGSGSVLSSFHLQNAAGTRGVIMQLNENSNPGQSTWIHNGTSWLKRFELFADGAFQFPNILMANLDGIVTMPGAAVVGTFLNSSIPLTVNKSVLPGNSTAVIQNLNNTAGTFGLVVNTANADATTVPFAVRSNGDDKLKVLGNGNVGIAHLSPTARLDIGTSGAVELGFTGSGTANILHQTSGQPLFINTTTADINIGANGSGSQHITVQSGGNVGIGTAIPAEKLDVNGNAKASVFIGGAFSNWSSPSAGGYALSTSAGAARWVNRTINPESGTDYDGADWILERRNNAGAGVFTAMYISRANGNVGIANTSPAQKLDVTGNIAASGAILTGGIVANLRVITASYSLTGSDYTIINRATTGTPTLTLPTAAGNAGRIYLLSDEAGTPNMMTLSPGIRYKGTTYTTLNNPFFAQGPRALVQSDGTNWVILIN